MLMNRRRALATLASAGLVVLAVPARAWADDDDDDRGGYRNGSGYRHNSGNRPNGNPSGNNITDQPGMSYEQSVRAGGEARETVYESAIKPVKDWLMEAMSGNATEVEAGRLAQERGESQEVRQFGQRMVTDHSTALDELLVLATTYGVEPIRGPVMDLHRRLIQNLMMRSGPDFDRFYMRSMVLEHRTDVHHYEMGVREQPSDVAAHAAKTLPILRDHLMMAEDIAQRLGVNTAG